jgi:peptidoglycan/xylan/chitin deacetylase (PgdA/CDA1 family)
MIFIVIIALMLVIVTLDTPSMLISIIAYGQQRNLNDASNNPIDSKVVILTFGDTHKSQFTTAKPILDKYGFKASFFITCSYADDQKKLQHLSWSDILALQEDGQDIESKGMTPVNLNNVSSKGFGF